MNVFVKYIILKLIFLIDTGKLILTNTKICWILAVPSPYMYVEVFQLYQVMVKQSSSNVVKWLGSFLIRFLRTDTKNWIIFHLYEKIVKMINVMISERQLGNVQWDCNCHLRYQFKVQLNS